MDVVFRKTEIFNDDLIRVTPSSILHFVSLKVQRRPVRVITPVAVCSARTAVFVVLRRRSGSVFTRRRSYERLVTVISLVHFARIIKPGIDKLLTRPSSADSYYAWSCRPRIYVFALRNTFLYSASCPTLQKSDSGSPIVIVRRAQWANDSFINPPTHFK